MATGTIKSYLADKGFGFISQGHDSSDMFFHSSALKDGDLEKVVRGAHVQYEVVSKRGKDQAASVTVVEMPEPVIAPRRKIDKLPQKELTALEEFEREWNLRPVQ